MSRKKVYREGDIFALPLSSGGFALGLAARVGRTNIVLGYFFGPEIQNLPTSLDLPRLKSNSAVAIGKFGDLGLQSGEWPILGCLDPWRREDWPLPAFGHIDIVDPNRAFRRRYDENRLNHMISETSISPREARLLPEDGLDGHLSLIIRLSKLLTKEDLETQ